VGFRPNPFTGKGGSGMPFVRNGELLKGLVFEKNGKEFMKVQEVQRARAEDFTPVDGEQWMPFDGGSNGGQWLHEPK